MKETALRPRCRINVGNMYNTGRSTETAPPAALADYVDASIMLSVRRRCSWKPVAMGFYEAMRGATLAIISARSLSGLCTACVIHDPNRVILQYADRGLKFRNLDGIAGRLGRQDDRLRNVRRLTE